MQQLNVNNPVRRPFPNWNIRAKIRKTDEQGNVLPNEYAFGSEPVRVSPRFQKNGANYRIRPERPAYFFAQFCVENGLLPVNLTPEECETDTGLEILQPLFDSYKQYLPKLHGATDQFSEPSLKEGYSFCIPQILVDQIGTIRTTANRTTPRPMINGSAPSSSVFESIKKRIEEMRAKSAPQPEAPPPTATAKKK